MNSQMSRIRQKLTFIGKIVICTLMASLLFSESHAQRKLINKEIPVSSSKLKFFGEEFGMTNRKTITGHSDDWLFGCHYQHWKGNQNFFVMQLCYFNEFHWSWQTITVQEILKTWKWVKPAIWVEADDKKLTVLRGNYQYRNFDRDDYKCTGFAMVFGVNGETGDPDRRLRGFYCQKNNRPNDKIIQSVLKSIGYKHKRWGFEAVKPSPTVTAKKTPTVTAEKSDTPFLSDYQKGFEAYSKGDYATALRVLRPLAEQGNAAAQFRMGEMYEMGRGVPRNDETASKWYRRSNKKTPATKKSSATVSNNWQSVPLAASWESKDNLLAGILKYKNKGGKGLIEASAGSISCKGTWQFVSGKYGTSNLPIGTWAIACKDGSAASGTYKSDKLGKGTGRGTDADGKTVKLTFGLN